ncbi:MAG: hypothetical protein K2M89_06435 [Clostridiales bacterium]|nr:hypothetical protein [Clostridiales bacterium]
MSLVNFPPPNTKITTPPTQQEATLNVAQQYEKASSIITDVIDGVRYTIECKEKGKKLPLDTKSEYEN